MAKSLKDFIEELKRQQQKSGKGSLTWYLDQIRKLADKKTPDAAKSDIEQIKSSAQAREDARLKKNQISPEEARKIAEEATVDQTSTIFDRSMIGKMLFFQYDAKWKEKLPYWDAFPVAFLFSVSNNSATGINLHYLPPVERARLMLALWSVVNTKKVDDKSKLLITYKILKGSSKFQFFRPCIKKYLFSNIRSRIMVINPLSWNQVMMLPTARFMKQNDFKVWSDSIAAIKKYQNK